MSPAPADGRSLDIDALSSHWRVALDAAADALAAAAACGRSLGFAGDELHDLRGRLTRERANVGELLEQAARQEHVRLARPLSSPRASRRMLGLPDDAVACVFDLEGVLTVSATIHATAWAETFDEFLERRAERTGERFAPFVPFEPSEYRLHLHGKPRIDGVHAFLASRGIRLPEGHPDDPPGAETAYGLGNRKDLAIKRRLDHEGVAAYGDSRLYLELVREAGLRRGVVSASSNAAAIVERAGLTAFIDAQVDGNLIRSERLRPTPAPDTLLAICRALRTVPATAALFETTLVGIDAGRAAGFGVIVAVERHGQATTFRAHGADVVVSDLGALLDPALALALAGRLRSRAATASPAD